MILTRPAAACEFEANDADQHRVWEGEDTFSVRVTAESSSGCFYQGILRHYDWAESSLRLLIEFRSLLV